MNPVYSAAKSAATIVLVATLALLPLWAEDAKSDATLSVRQVEQLKSQIAAQQQQLESMRRLLDEQQQTLDRLLTRIASTTPISPAAKMLPAAKADLSPPIPIVPAKTDDLAPLSFKIGSAYLTPTGFMDLTFVQRDTNPGSGIGTNFGSLPFGDTAPGKLGETRLSAQNSRVGFRVDAKVNAARVLGYLESDFLGAVPGNVAVTSNSTPLRLRLYWVDVRQGKWEVLGGQSWSMLTPNRNGLSALPSDLFHTQDIDVNYQAGLVWSRDPQVRLIYHPTGRLSLGVSFEAPEQYIGGSAGGGLVTLPSTLSAVYATELNNGSTSLSVPNARPDIIGKIAYDSRFHGRPWHVEVAGVSREFKAYNPGNTQMFTANGQGGSFNFLVEPIKNIRLISSNFVSAGGGRWIFGQAPDVVVRGNGSLSPVHASSTVSGVEVPAGKTQFYSYYGGVYIQRNVAVDPANGKLVGYGFAGGSSAQNRTIQELTFGANRTLWSEPRFGGLSLMAQYSHIFRNPWSVTPGGLSQAVSNVVFMNLRYTLPGAAPILK